MLSNAFAFELVFDWRCWRGQRVKYVVLIVGFALVCALLALALRLGAMLFYQPPPWVHRTASFYTLARRHPGVGMQPINRHAIEKLRRVPGVGEISYLAFQTLDLEHERRRLSAVSVAFFKDNFPQLVGAEFPGGHTSNAQHLAWISQRLFAETFSSERGIIGSTLRDKRIPYPFTIAGVLPRSMNRIGAHRPDVWLDSRNLRYHTPFAMPTPGSPNPRQEQMVERFLAGAGMYFGIFAAAPDLTAGAIAKAVEQIELVQADGPSMRFVDDGAKLWVLPGVSLNPAGRNHLRSQWVALVALIAALLLVLTFNALTVFASQLVLRWDDLRVMRIVGAGQRHWLQGALASLAPAVVVIVLLSWWMLLVGRRLVEHTPVYQAFAGSLPLLVAPSHWIGAVALVVIVLALCKSLPLLALSRKNLFTRAVGSTHSRAQYWLGQTNLVLQLSMALLAVGVAGSMAFSEWMRHRQIPVDRTIQQIVVKHHGQGRPPAEIHGGGFPGLPGVPVAGSVPAFDGVGISANITHASLRQAIPVNVFYVSKNYFDLLGIPKVTPPGSWAGGAVLSQRAANLLGAGPNPRTIIGSSLVVKGMMAASFPVVGVVANAPHLGLGTHAQPVIYLPLKRALITRGLSFYAHPRDVPKLQLQIEHWAGRELVGARVNKPVSIGRLIARMDRARIGLLYSTLTVAALIALLVFIGLGYQIKARLAIARHEYGVRLAVGAPGSRLLAVAGREVLAALLFALPLALAGQWLLQQGTAGKTPFEVFHPAVVPLGLVVMLVLIVIAAGLAVGQLLRLPIFQILREE